MTDRAHMPARSKIPSAALLRRAARRRDDRLRVAGVRREHRVVALLHLRHHRQSQGRAVQPPLDGAARATRSRCPTRSTARPATSVLPVVPMFHVNAWGLPYAAPHGRRQAGAARGRAGRPALYELFESERVTLSAGVPTVWLGLLDARRSRTTCSFSHVEAHRDRRLGLPAGDDQTFEDDYGVQVMHAWGMTEMSPLGTVATLQAASSATCRRRAASPCGPSRAAPCSAST